MNLFQDKHIPQYPDIRPLVLEKSYLYGSSFPIILENIYFMDILVDPCTQAHPHPCFQVSIS